MERCWSGKIFTVGNPNQILTSDWFNEVDEDLKKIREVYDLKLNQYEGRWRKLEHGQLQVKQNLVKFNNFVKEKKTKIEEGELRSKKLLELLKMKETHIQ